MLKGRKLDCATNDMLRKHSFTPVNYISIAQTFYSTLSVIVLIKELGLFITCIKKIKEKDRNTTLYCNFCIVWISKYIPEHYPYEKHYKK